MNWVKHTCTNAHTHTHAHPQPFYCSLDFVRYNLGEPVPEETFTHSHLSWSSVIPYLLFYLLRSMASSLFNLSAWQSFSIISLQVFFGLPYTILHQSLSSFRSTCPYHCNLFCCSTEIMSSSRCLLLNPLLGTLSCNLKPHIHLTILISACWSATLFSYLTGQISLPCNILLRTQLLYNLPLTHTHTHTHNHFTALWIWSGTTRVSRYQKKHSPTHTHRGHQSSLSAFSIYYDPWHPPCSIHVLYSLFPQSLSKFSLVCLLAWHPPLHTPYISSPSHYVLSQHMPIPLQPVSL